MNPIELLVIAFALSMDAFAVSLAAAVAGFAPDRRATFRLAFHFGLFQGIMPLLGWSVGSIVDRQLAHWDHWVAFFLLGLVGFRMIRAGLHPDGYEPRNDPSRGWSLVMLSTATSIDALAVGLTLAALQVQVVYPSLVIGLVTGCMCVAAIAGGRRVGTRFGDRAQIAGGVVLLLVGLKVLVSHLA